MKEPPVLVSYYLENKLTSSANKDCPSQGISLIYARSYQEHVQGERVHQRHVIQFGLDCLRRW